MGYRAWVADHLAQHAEMQGEPHARVGLLAMRDKLLKEERRMSGDSEMVERVARAIFDAVNSAYSAADDPISSANALIASRAAILAMKDALTVELLDRAMTQLYTRKYGASISAAPLSIGIEEWTMARTLRGEAAINLVADQHKQNYETRIAALTDALAKSQNESQVAWQRMYRMDVCPECGEKQVLDAKCQECGADLRAYEAAEIAEYERRAALAQPSQPAQGEE